MYLLMISSQDYSILAGLRMTIGCYMGDQYLGDNTLSTFEYIQDLVQDSTGFLADLIMDIILHDYGRPHFLSKEWLIMEGYLVKLHEQGYDCSKYRLGEISSSDEFRWDRQTLCELMLLLVEAGANALGKSIFGLGFIPYLMHCKDKYRTTWAFKDLLYAFVQAGADVHERDRMQRTCSMKARALDIWPLWCQALQDSGKDIEEVLRVEGNEWLLADDWENILFERTDYLESSDYYSEDCDESGSDVETSDEDDENASTGEDKFEIEFDDEEGEIEGRDEEVNEDRDSESEGNR